APSLFRVSMEEPMNGKRVGIALASLVGIAALATPSLAQNEQFIPQLVYRTGAYAPNGIPVANGIADYYNLINERDGGINGVKIAFEECDNRLCHRPRRGVLRAAEGQRPNRRGLCIPALDRHHLCAHGKGAARQDSAHYHGLRPLGVARRLGIPVELPAARHLLDGRRHSPAAHRKEGRRVRQAQGQEDRARLSRLALRQGADRAPAEARADARIRDHVPAGHASWCRAEGNLPDYGLLWGWGGMNSTAIKEAVGVGYPREKVYGVWWSGAEPDVRPAEDGAKGYNAAALQHTSGHSRCTRI